MLIKEKKSLEDIHIFLMSKIVSQNGFEENLPNKERKRNGVYFTRSLSIINNVLEIIKIDYELFGKKILEPSCGQGIFLLKLLTDIYLKIPDEKLIKTFISENIYFVDIDESMLFETEANIKALYYFLFETEYCGTFNSILWDYTDKVLKKELFNNNNETPFSQHYGTFDYIIGNPPYVTLYGRRDKKLNEQQRIKYLYNYDQFPNNVKNGKINLVMLFIEHSLDLLKDNGSLGFIVDVSFFETAYQYTRKYILQNAKINEIQINIKEFDVGSGQIIIKLTKSNNINDNTVKIIDSKLDKTFYIQQNIWNNYKDEYKFRINGCDTSKNVIQKITSKNDRTLLELYPKKNLRTCTMLLDMEDKFTFDVKPLTEHKNVYPFYQGSKSLNEKFGKLSYSKYFVYDKKLQDKINDELKIKLKTEGIKNKKRIGLGEEIVYRNPKLYIRQSAKEIIATVDEQKSSSNNSLYVFSLRNSLPESLEFMYFLCGFLNSELITYYSQKMNIIRFSAGKQPQIKISDLGSIFIPKDVYIRSEIAKNCRVIYKTPKLKEDALKSINDCIFSYYNLSITDIDNIRESIKSF